MHEAREDAKAARYAGESVERVFGEDAAASARAMDGVQEALGSTRTPCSRGSGSASWRPPPPPPRPPPLRPPARPRGGPR
ncbi:CHAD domain-containing protein [Blastococcus sp. SYSU DS0533]